MPFRDFLRNTQFAIRRAGIRLILAIFVLLAATWNPTQWNFVNWVMANGTNNLPITVLAGLVLLVGYVV